MKGGSDKPAEPINIGIYGHTGAGKTRFLFELLEGWSRSGKILSRSANCEQFLTDVRKEIKQFKKPRPTPDNVEQISVQVVLQDGKEPIQLVFRDLPGEMLSRELDKDQLDAEGKIPSQVKHCDAFLFFFDPGSRERKHHLERHHEDELRRAGKFVEYVLQTRENAYLPIVFVQTHRDVWENDSEITQKAEKWQSEANALVKRLYSEYLKHHFPELLCDARKTQHAISSIRGREVERPIQAAVELAHAARSFLAKDKNRAIKWCALVGSGVLVFCLFLILFIVYSGPDVGQVKQTAQPVPQNEHEAERALDNWEQVRKNHPLGRHLPDRKGAEEVNRYLRWLTEFMEGINDDSSAYGGWSRKTRKRLESAWREAVALIGDKMKVDNSLSPDEIDVLAQYLKEIPAKPLTTQIGGLQDKFWEIARKCVVERTAEVLKRRRKIASKPNDTIEEAHKTLHALLDRMTQYKVGLVNAGEKTIDDLRTAVTLFEDIKNRGTYSVSFSIVEASLDSDNKHGHGWLLIRILSPNQKPFSILLEPHKKGESKWELKSRQPTYEVDLGLGPPLKCELFVSGSPEKWTPVHEFDVLHDLPKISLADVGLNLVLRDRAHVESKLSGAGYALTVSFTPRAKIPDLIWEAVQLSMEEKKR